MADLIDFGAVAALRRSKPVPAASGDDPTDDAEMWQRWTTGRVEAVFSGAWARYVDASLDDPAFVGRFHGAADRLRAATPDQNIVIYGDVGTGKTFAAAALLKERLMARGRCSMLGITDLLDAARREMGEEGGGGLIDRLSVVDTLLLDDVGSERQTDWAQELVSGLIDRRYRSRLGGLVVTTNLSLVELRPWFGERVADRLVETSVFVELAGLSYRRSGDG